MPTAEFPTGADDPRSRVRRYRLIETGVFLLVLLTWMGFAAIGTPPQDLHFSVVATAIVFRNLALTALALYLVWRNGEGMGAIGWIRRSAGREALIGVVLFVPMTIGVALVTALLHAWGLAEPLAPPSYLFPRSGADYALALVLLAVVAISEETVFRGYLLRRFAQVTGRRSLAVVLTSTLFALGHAYEGALGAIATGVIGVVLALVYLRRGSLVAPMTMHFVQDFIGLIIVPRFFG
jgi:CAAX protease family protein